MLRASILLAALTGHAAGNTVLTLQSNDLVGGTPALDNVKALWSAAVGPAKLSLLFDRKAKANGIQEAKLAGSMADIKYVLTHKFGAATALALQTKQAGVTVKADGDDTDYLKSVSASYPVDAGPASLVLEPSYMVKSKVAKLKVSAAMALAGGLGLSSKLTATGTDDISADLSVDYDVSLGNDLALSASVSPLDKEGEVTLTGSTQNPSATWVGSASMAMGESPQLTLKRVQKF